MVKYIRRISSITASLLCLLVFSGVGALTANAASNNQPNGFTVSPVINEITVSKGQSQVVDITVSNPAKENLIASPIANDFVASNDETGTPRLILKSNVQLPANNFISLVSGGLSSQTITPNGSVTFPVTITVPQDAASGGYYGAIRFVPGNATNTANVGLNASVGSLFIVTVPGNLKENASIVQLSAAKDGALGSFFSGGNISIVTRIKDTGNIQIAPFGNIIIKNSSGKIVASTQLNQETPRGLILPGSIRKFSNNVNYHHWLGHYTIIANLGYGSSGQLLTTQTSFWYIPVWFMVLVVILIIVVVAVIYWIYRNVNRRKFSRKR